MTHPFLKKKYRQMQLILIIHLLLWAWIILMTLGPEWTEFGNFSSFNNFGIWNGLLSLYLVVSSPLTQMSPAVYLWRHRDRLDES